MNPGCFALLLGWHFLAPIDGEVAPGRGRGRSGAGAILLALLATVAPGVVLPGPVVSLAAQAGHDAGSDSVPRALAEALVGRGSAAARILVGEAPPGWDLRIESGMELLGSVERENGSAVMVLATDRDPATLREALMGLLVGQGWERLERRPGASMGFVPAGGSAGPFMLCRDGRETVALQAFEGDPGLVYLDYHDRGPGGIVPCDAPARERLEAIRVRFPIPDLEAPEGVALAPAGTSTGSGSLGTAAFLRGDTTLEGLEAHFGSRLRDQGWVRLDEDDGPASGSVRSTLWERPVDGEAAGRDGPGPWIGVLTLSRVGEGPVRADFQAYRAGERRSWTGGRDEAGGP